MDLQNGSNDKAGLKEGVRYQEAASQKTQSHDVREALDEEAERVGRRRARGTEPHVGAPGFVKRMIGVGADVSRYLLNLPVARRVRKDLRKHLRPGNRR